MPFNNEQYMNLVTSQYAESQKFNEMLRYFLEMLSPSVSLLDSFNQLFNLSEASGDQLDKLGTVVGIPRILPINDPNIPAVLSDEEYRIVIKAKILSDGWNGTTEQWRQIIEQMLPDAAFEINDRQDMSIDVVIIDPGSSATLVALLMNGYIVPKPAGVLVNWSISSDPLFGHDSNTDIIKGYDLGIWSNR